MFLLFYVKPWTYLCSVDTPLHCARCRDKHKFKIYLNYHEFLTVICLLCLYIVCSCQIWSSVCLSFTKDCSLAVRNENIDCTTTLYIFDLSVVSYTFTFDNASIHHITHFILQFAWNLSPARTEWKGGIHSGQVVGPSHHSLHIPRAT